MTRLAFSLQAIMQYDSAFEQYDSVCTRYWYFKQKFLLASICAVVSQQFIEYEQLLRWKQ